MRVLSCLIEYCKVRYEQCGRRLSVLVKAKENMQNESVLGFFMLDKDAGRIYSMTHSDGNGGYKFMTHDFAGANDWEVLKPWSLEAVLHSAELDTNIKLVSRFGKTQQVEFGPESDQWDIPHEQVVAIAAGIPFASAQRVVAAPPASIAGPPPPGSGASLPKATPHLRRPARPLPGAGVHPRPSPPQQGRRPQRAHRQLSVGMLRCRRRRTQRAAVLLLRPGAPRRSAAFGRMLRVARLKVSSILGHDRTPVVPTL